METYENLTLIVCELTRRGASMTEIMKTTGLTEKPIRKIQMDNGLKQAVTWTKITPEIISNVIALHDSGFSSREIAIKTGIGRSTVSHTIQKYNKQQNHVKSEEPSPLDMLESALEMALQAVRKMKE